jgi:Poly-adenylate binding protein, unique domain
MEDDIKKKALGTILYPLIRNIIAKNETENANEMTPKVTGMLIDLDVLSVGDILDSIKTEEVLARRVAEALDLIKEDNRGE